MFIGTDSVADVKNEYPSAYKIVKVCGGYMVFFTRNDYATWINQK